MVFNYQGLVWKWLIFNVQDPQYFKQHSSTHILSHTWSFLVFHKDRADPVEMVQIMNLHQTAFCQDLVYKIMC